MLNTKTYAIIHGTKDFPDINGAVGFSKTERGVLVTAEIYGLPQGEESVFGVHGFHIHSGESCTGDKDDELKNTGTHYNPENLSHPYHAGDMPPLFSNNGYSYMQFVTNRFRIDDIVGKTVVIHLLPDDFTTQPSGNSGKKIGCGVIVRAR